MVTETLPFEQIAANGQKRLSEIRADLLHIEDALRSTQDRLAHIASEREKRAATLQQAEENLSALEQAHTQAAGYAQIAAGTAQERLSLQAATRALKALQAAQKAHETNKEQWRIAEETDASEEIQLTAQLAELEKQHAQTKRDLAQMTAAAGQAQTEYGEQTYQARLAAYQEKQALATRAHRAYIEALAEADTSFHEGLEVLEQWPDLRQRFFALQEPDNATTRLLKATALYLEALTEDFDRGVYFQPWGMYTTQIISLPGGAPTDMPGMNRERSEKIRKALEYYVNRLKEQGV